jgi:hypothetical protein
VTLVRVEDNGRRLLIESGAEIELRAKIANQKRRQRKVNALTISQARSRRSQHLRDFSKTRDMRIHQIDDPITH